uniref:EF-hand domain-containing protein n=1 Tax=Anopheles coluzzii TaxID=1518534 RepID=A0A8W7PAU3_ANOCL
MTFDRSIFNAADGLSANTKPHPGRETGLEWPGKSGSFSALPLTKPTGPNYACTNDLRTAFDLLDRDQDGHVTPEELQFMLRNLGIHVRDELIDDLLREASRTGHPIPTKARFTE